MQCAVLQKHLELLEHNLEVSSHTKVRYFGALCLVSLQCYIEVDRFVTLLNSVLVYAGMHLQKTLPPAKSKEIVLLDCNQVEV